jgi:hypothetical protein
MHNGLIPAHITALSMTVTGLNESTSINSCIITVATEQTLLYLKPADGPVCHHIRTPVLQSYKVLGITSPL